MLRYLNGDKKCSVASEARLVKLFNFKRSHMYRAPGYIALSTAYSGISLFWYSVGWLTKV